jgi:zinc transport system substrate-binding protein
MATLPGVAAAERIAVSVLPLVPLVSSIVGDGVEVRSLQQEGDACGIFEPRPSILSWLAGADALVRVGAAYEAALLDRLQRQSVGMAILDLRHGMEPLGGGHVHGAHCAAGCGGHATHADDPHIWLDPRRMAQQIDALEPQLIQLYPQREQQIRSNAAQLRERLLRIDHKLETLLQPHAGKAFFIYHPALSYFAERYGLQQVAIAPTPSGPSPRELHALIQQARSMGIRTVFVQPQESRQQAEIVAKAIGGITAEIDPLSPDWEANLMRIAKALATSFTAAGS